MRLVQTLGVTEIELASCEVKASSQNWEQFIFEAISHKRFCNRSWFCYRVSTEEPLPKSMEYYAERYRVGIIQIVLSSEDIEALKNNEANAENYLSSVQERQLAFYEHVALQEKKEMIERSHLELGVKFEFDAT